MQGRRDAEGREEPASFSSPFAADSSSRPLTGDKAVDLPEWLPEEHLIHQPSALHTLDNNTQTPSADTTEEVWTGREGRSPVLLHQPVRPVAPFQGTGLSWLVPTFSDVSVLLEGTFTIPPSLCSSFVSSNLEPLFEPLI